MDILPGCRSFCSLRCQQQTMRHKSFSLTWFVIFLRLFLLLTSNVSTRCACYIVYTYADTHTPYPYIRFVYLCVIFSEYTFISWFDENVYIFQSSWAFSLKFAMPMLSAMFPSKWKQFRCFFFWFLILQHRLSENVLHLRCTAGK